MQIDRAVDAILAGEVIIYPTETLYALGAGAFRTEAAQRIVEIKDRPKLKPLPLIIGHRSQLPLVTGWLSKAFEVLMEDFWPGPLSILVPARRDLPDEVKDENGMTSVRWTAHPTAAALCMRAGTPLIATSANPSGGEAAATPEQLDRRLVEQVAVAIIERPEPGGGKPSTVVRCLGTHDLELIRDGAISRQQLERSGFTITLR